MRIAKKLMAIIVPKALLAMGPSVKALLATGTESMICPGRRYGDCSLTELIVPKPQAAENIPASA